MMTYDEYLCERKKLLNQVRKLMEQDASICVRRADEILERVSLLDYQYRDAGKHAGGMKR